MCRYYVIIEITHYVLIYSSVENFIYLNNLRMRSLFVRTRGTNLKKVPHYMYDSQLGDVRRRVPVPHQNYSQSRYSIRAYYWSIVSRHDAWIIWLTAITLIIQIWLKILFLSVAILINKRSKSILIIFMLLVSF